MLGTMEIIKDQIKAIQYEQQTIKKSEVQELQELVEFINYDRSILLSENQRLTQLVNDNPWKEKYLKIQELLDREKEKNRILMIRIEELEEMHTGTTSSSKSYMGSGSYTDRPVQRSSTYNSKNENAEISLNSSMGYQTKKVRHNSSLSKSPVKPPKGGDRNIGNQCNNRSPNKATDEIKSNLAKAIDQAHRSLFFTMQNNNRSISPCLNSGSSRYSTPPKKIT